VRNAFDLSCLAGPSKYHHYKDFYKYYNGEVVTMHLLALENEPFISACSQPFLQAAPILTIFVGGNHEAANHLRELYVPLVS
jgi:lariat debranching enzyme